MDKDGESKPDLPGNSVTLNSSGSTEAGGKKPDAQTPRACVFGSIRSAGLRFFRRRCSKPPESSEEVGIAAWSEADRQSLGTLYEKTRQIIEHEDALIAERITWFLQLQGFLFAAFGISLSAMATMYTTPASTPHGNPPWIAYHPVLDPSEISLLSNTRAVMCWMGMISALIVQWGITAAHFAILDRERDYEVVRAKILGEDFRFPSTRRGPDELPKLMSSSVWVVSGLSPASFLPLMCAGGWAWLARQVSPDQTPKLIRPELVLVSVVFATTGLKFLLTLLLKFAPARFIPHSTPIRQLVALVLFLFLPGSVFLLQWYLSGHTAMETMVLIGGWWHSLITSLKIAYNNPPPSN